MPNPVSAGARATASVRFLSVAMALLVSGCLGSRVPLVGAQSAAFPVAAGTVVSMHQIRDGKHVPMVDQTTGQTRTARLDIAEGRYVLQPISAKPEAMRFRLKEIAGSNDYVIMTFQPDEDMPKEQSSSTVYHLYGLLRAQDGYFIGYGFEASHFDKYWRQLEANEPDRWRHYAAQNWWRRAADGKDVEVLSLGFLETILPEMASGGFHIAPVEAYRPLAGATP